MPLGQNKGKFIGWHYPKIQKITNLIWHLSSIHFSDVTTSLASILGFKIMDFETLRFCTFWGPCLNQFSKLDRIIQFTWFITLRKPCFGCLAWKFSGLNYSNSNHGGLTISLLLAPPIRTMEMDKLHMCKPSIIISNTMMPVLIMTLPSWNCQHLWISMLRFSVLVCHWLLMSHKERL